MPSEAMKRSRKKWLEYQKRREEQNWTRMSYYDKVHVGDLVESVKVNGAPYAISVSGLVIATADTVEQPPEWGDTHVLWHGNHEPVWEDCGALEVTSEGS